MRRMFAALLLIAAAQASAVSGEDAAHRADRRRTEQLNRDAGSVVDRRVRRNADGQARYRQAQADYARRMQAWRRQVAACEAGDYAACDRR